MEVSRKRARHGGQRQRVQQILREDDPREAEGSALAEHLLHQWAWSEFSPQQVQILASLAVDDIKHNRNLQKLEELAAAGTHGRYQNRCYTAVLKLTEKKVRLAKPYIRNGCCKQCCFRTFCLQTYIMTTKRHGPRPFALGNMCLRSFGPRWSKVAIPTSTAA